ncbi:MAG: hypothetical protein U0835_18515 [Isosphaeraceae bacterium]
MAWKETLLERPIRRPLDDQLREAINAVYHRRRHEIPIATELHWHPAKPQFTLKSKFLSFVGHFTADKLVVDAELGLTARLMATDEHRTSARRFIEEIVDDLGI